MPLTRKESRKAARQAVKQRKAEHYNKRQEYLRKVKKPSPKFKQIHHKNGPTKRRPQLGFSKKELAYGAPTGSDQEDERLIEYLETQLGVKGDKQKASKLIKKIAAEEFGGDDLLDMVDDILEDRFDSATQMGDESESDMEPGSDKESESDEISGSNMKRGSDLESGSGSEEVPYQGEHSEDVEMDSEQDISDEADSAEDESAREADSAEDDEDASTVSRKKPNPENTASVGAYVPPHLRSKQQASMTEQSGTTKMTLGMTLTRLKPVVKSNFNRVAEGNLNVICDSLMKEIVQGKENLTLGFVTKDGQHSKLKECLSDYVTRICEFMADQSMDLLKAKAGANLTAPQMALLAAMSALVNTRLVPVFLSKALSFFDQSMSKILSHESPEILEENDFDPSIEWADHCRQVLTAVSMLHFFGLIDSGFVLTLMRHISGEGSTRGTKSTSQPHVISRRLEMLSIVIRLCGSTLKTDCPGEFTQLVKIIDDLLESVKDESNIHIDFIRQELSNLSKLRKAPMYEKFVAMKSWLHSKGGRFKAINWSSVSFDPENAREAAVSLFKGVVPETTLTDNLAKFDHSDVTDSKTAQLLNLAKQLKIKSPLQQQAFVALVGADDVEDACFRLLKIAAKNTQLPHVVAVILHCASQEKVYNEYYQEVLIRLCQSNDTLVAKKFARVTRQGIHNIVIALEDSKDLRRKAIIAKLYTALIDSKILKVHQNLIDKLSN